MIVVQVFLRFVLGVTSVLPRKHETRSPKGHFSKVNQVMSSVYQDAIGWL